MKLPELDPARSTQALLGDILQYVETANGLITKRDAVNLGGLDATVAALCARIVAMEPDAARDYAPQLEQLMEKIEDMQARMVALQGEVGSAIKSLGTSKKAVHAYSKAPSGKVGE